MGVGSLRGFRNEIRGPRRYLVYLINQALKNGSLNNIDLHDQNTAP
jgi:hypothetical protein